jgi:hypothetical protein
MITEQIFEEQILSTIEELKELLIVKGKEYRRNNNPYHNFDVGAKMTGQTPERILNGFLLKHLISYNDILNDLDKGIKPKEKIVNEKLNDILVYFLIQKTMLINNCEF